MQQLQRMHCSPPRHRGTTKPQDLAVFSIGDQPIPFRTSLPSPSDTEEKKGGGRQATISAHPDMIFNHLGKSAGWNSYCVLPTSLRATFLAPAAEKQASPQQDTRPGPEYSYSLGFVPPRTPPHELCVHPYELLPPSPDEFTRASCMTPHEFMTSTPCARPNNGGSEQKSEHAKQTRIQNGEMTTIHQRYAQNFVACYAPDASGKAPQTAGRNAWTTSSANCRVSSTTSLRDAGTRRKGCHQPESPETIRAPGKPPSHGHLQIG